jgi:acylphosphatase
LQHAEGEGIARLEVLVSGRVQGVNFRAHTQREAERLGLKGYALNRADGSVEVVAEGARTALEKLLAWLQHGPAQARVEQVRPRWQAARGEFARFEVRP